jgi:hypothetical protein
MQLLTRLALAVIIALACQEANSAQPIEETVDSHNYVPKEGIVPNTKVASKIAEAILMEVYGEQQIRKQMPFIVTLSGGIWTVKGQLHGKPYVKGGVAVIEISRIDGKVLRLSHGV